MRSCGNGNDAITSGSSPARKRATTAAGSVPTRNDVSPHPERPTRVPWMGRPLASRCRPGADDRSTLRPATAKASAPGGWPTARGEGARSCGAPRRRSAPPCRSRYSPPLWRSDAPRRPTSGSRVNSVGPAVSVNAASTGEGGRRRWCRRRDDQLLAPVPGFSSWPPNCLRIAESTLSPKSAWPRERETLVQRGGQHRRGHALVDRGERWSSGPRPNRSPGRRTPRAAGPRPAPRR